jgi:hypothetical protein
MAIFKSLVKTVLTLSPAHMARYRQSFKLKDACSELREYGFTTIVERYYGGPVFLLESDTDISSHQNLALILCPPLKLRIILITKDYVESVMSSHISNYIDAQIVGRKKIGEGKNWYVFVRSNGGVVDSELKFLSFHPNVPEPHREISTKEMVDKILKRTELLCGNVLS